MDAFQTELAKANAGQRPNPEAPGLQIWQAAVLRTYLRRKDRT